MEKQRVSALPSIWLSSEHTLARNGYYRIAGVAESDGCILRCGLVGYRGVGLDGKVGDAPVDAQTTSLGLVEVLEGALACECGIARANSADKSLVFSWELWAIANRTLLP